MEWLTGLDSRLRFQLILPNTVVASNIPGIVVSVWLNVGASKIQYNEMMMKENNDNTNTISEEEEDSSSTTTTTTTPNTKDKLAFTPQDVLWIRIMILWLLVLICVGWLGIVKTHQQKTEIIGFLANINVLFFYGAPLQKISSVFQEKTSNSIHTPTMILNNLNAGFWGLYGIARNDIVIYGPNGIGFILGLIQLMLCCIYPKTSMEINDVDTTPLLLSEENNENGEVQEGANTTTSASATELPLLFRAKTMIKCIEY